MKRNLGLSALLLFALAPRSASADLTGIFADALAVDAEFATGVTGATDIAFAPDGRAVITRKSGDVTIRLTDGSTELLQNVFDVNNSGEQGLLGVVADPTMPNAFYFYASVSGGMEQNGNRQQVFKGVLDADNTLTIDPSPVVAEGKNPGDPGLEGPANHNGGGLFAYGTHLYLGVGDTGANATTPVNKFGSCLNKGNGKILRVNLDGSIPDDNPLVNVDSVTACDTSTGAWTTAAPDTRVFAWGFRNPWRFFIDSQTDRMWIGDVGESSREEISVSAPVQGYMGEHFGFPFYEGNLDHRPPSGSSLDGKSDCMADIVPGRPCVAAVYDYTTTMSSRGSVTGGIIPEGCGWGDAFGGTTYYFFADYVGDWIRALEVNEDRSSASSTAVEAGTLGNGPVSFRQGPGGGMYLVLYQANAVVEIKPRNQTGDDCESTGGAGGAGGTAGSGGSGGTGGNDTGGSAGDGAGGTLVAGSGGTPSAGSGPGGGSGPVAGAPSSGGSGGAGVSGSSGSGNTTGGSTATGGTSNAGRGGNATAGSAGAQTAGQGTAGASGSGSEPSEEDSGCGCRVAGKSSGSLAGLLAALGAAAFVARRRRRS